MAQYILGSGEITEGGDTGGIERAAAEIRPGDLVELRLTLPFPWPEWIGPISVHDAVLSIAQSFVRDPSVTIDGNTLTLTWRA